MDDAATVDVGNIDSLMLLAARIFGEVLSLDGISEDDDFFDDCGGSSLQAWMVAVAIEDELDVDLEFPDMLDDFTPRGIASFLLR